MRKKILWISLISCLAIQISLQADAPNPRYRPYIETPLPRNDMEITQAVKDAIRNDRRVYTYSNTINITTQNNIVTLEGRVNSEETRRILGDLAQSIPGVYYVVNNIFVTFPTDVNKRIISP